MAALSAHARTGKIPLLTSNYGTAYSVNYFKTNQIRSGTQTDDKVGLFKNTEFH
jgi:hypothetical protein